MKKLPRIKELLQLVLQPGDILFIVPPFAVREYSILGPHILQSIAEQNGYKCEILYANILLAAITGADVYDKISKLPYRLRAMKWGELLFTRAAYPDGLTKVFGGPGTFFQKGPWFLDLEKICTSFVDEVAQALAAFQFPIVGCTTTLEQTNCSIAILRSLKKIQPTVLTLMGGSNSDGIMAEGIASLSPDIDYVFSGESERSFNTFLKNFSHGKLPSQRVLTGAPLDNLDSLPTPRYDSFVKQVKLFRGDTDNEPDRLIIAYETGRGCWRGEKQKCSFCGLHNDNLRFRQKSSEKVLADLEIICRSYPVDGIIMTDNITPHSYYKTLFPLLAQEKKFPSLWYQENSGLTLNHLVNLKKARIGSVLFGIDALSGGLLRQMNKSVKASQNLLLLRNARSVGIYILWFMLWGFPGDKIEYYRETLTLLPLIRHLQPPEDFVHLILNRFCSYVENPQKYGITHLKPLDVYRDIYPEGAEIDRLAYEFTGDYPCAAHEHPEIIRALADEIDVWQNSWTSSSLAMHSSAGSYVINDNRKITGEDQTYTLDYSRAKEIMRYDTYSGTPQQTWALEQKLGVLVDARYVPLVTASPELLVEFQS